MAPAWVLLVLLVGGVQAQSNATADYRAYPLKNKPAAQVEKALTEALAGMEDSTHLVVDSRKNQILLRGPEKAQQIARRLIESMDHPGKDLTEPEARIYSCQEGQLAQTVARLRKLYADRKNVQVASDSQSGKIVVLAPPAIHDEIAQQIPAPGIARSQGKPGRTAQADEESVEEFVALARLRTDEAETQLRELLGYRLTPLAGRTNRSAYRYADSAGRRVELTFDGPRHGVAVQGPGSLVKQFISLVRNLDGTLEAEGRSVRVVPLRNADPAKVQEAVEAYRSGMRPSRPSPKGTDQGSRRSQNGIELVSYLFQAEGEAPAKPAPKGPAPEALIRVPAGKDREKSGLQPGALQRIRELGVDVDIETLPDLDVIILRGRQRDVEEVRKIIEEIERLSAETQPTIDIYQLRNVSGDALLSVMRQVQQEFLGARQGRVTIVPLMKPNALLLIGWGEAVTAAKELIARLDISTNPQAEQRTFRLRHAPAASVQRAILDFFAAQGVAGLAPKVTATVDPRTNSIIVQAAPRDMAEVELLIEKLDIASTNAVLQTRIFRLQNTLALDLYATLQNAIQAARGGAVGAAAAAAGGKSSALELMTIDPKNQERLIKSGVLTDVQITPDPRLNILVVSAPAESMELIAALIKQLDSPGFVAQIKVFTLRNADAATMATMLRSLVPAQPGAGAQLSAAEGESSTLGLRFSVDPRTNSIIAVGAAGDLRIIEALLMRLDLQDVQARRTSIYRLKNSPAVDVANAVNLFLRSERQVQMAAPGLLSPFQQIESEVVVVPEPVSNSLIISATPRFFDEIMHVVEKLDAQPAQVMIQVLIADVQLRNTDEFGVELGLQDSILFDRSILSGNLTQQTTSTQQSTPSGIITQTQTNFPAASLSPGFLFNTPDLGNSASNVARESPKRLGTQGLGSFGMGRVNNELGFGGLVLSASSESVSVLMRALHESQRLEVLGRPHVMTLDNQPAFIQIGARVPRITAATVSPTVGSTNSVVLENVGLILGVTPRISPDGTVVMEVDAERSELGPEAEGIPISIVDNTVIRSPRINTTMAQTTVSAQDGETIILGGLITKNSTTTNRKVPYLGDVPLLGNLFRYDFHQTRRTELLIVLTPHVIRGPEDMDRVKRIESARMHWCLADVQQLQGETGLTQMGGTPTVVYPDQDPRGTGKQDPGMLTPNGNGKGSSKGNGKREEITPPTPLQDLRSRSIAPPPEPELDMNPPGQVAPDDRQGARRERGRGNRDLGGSPEPANPLRMREREIPDYREDQPISSAVYNQGSNPVREQ